MEERSLRNNYIFTLVKSLLFLIIFCFFIELFKEFCKVLKGKDNFSINVFFFSMLSAFSFYIFLADLNNFYNKIQNFFFRSYFFSLLFPSVVIILGVGYLIIPRLLNIPINKDIFLFAGTFALTGHLIFVARRLKGHTFNSFINYIFIFSLLCTLNLFLFEFYLKIAFKVNIGKMAFVGIKNGAGLIQSLFTHTFR